MTLATYLNSRVNMPRKYENHPHFLSLEIEIRNLDVQTKTHRSKIRKIIYPLQTELQRNYLAHQTITA